MKKLCCCLLAVLMLICCFAGCGNTGSGESGSASKSPAASGSAPTAEPTGSQDAPGGEDDSKFVTFPITEEKTVTMFTSIEQSLAPYIEDYSQTSLIRGWSEATGVEIEVTAVSAEAASNLFSVMLSGGEMSDIIVQGGAWYPGGSTAGVNDEVFLNLVDYKEYMPNYLAVIEKYGFTNNVMTDDMINSFWQINANNFPTAGIVVRGDMLDAIGMDHDDIKTFDDWTEMLRALKTQPGVKAPLALSVIGDMGTNVVLSGGFDTSVRYQNGSYVNLPLYVVNGEVKFGFLEDNYDRYVSLISGWYKEGLINENIASMEGGPYAQDYVMRGENVVYTTMYGMMADTAEGIGGGAYFTPLYFPVEKEGQVYHFSSFDEVALESGVWNVSADAQDKELIIQMIDWFYTDEGSRLASYGIEGEAYNIENGEIVLTDLILHNPDGLTASNAMNLYAGDLVPAVKDTKRLFSTFNDDVIETIDWVSQQETDSSYNLPSGLSASFTEEEQATYNTYSSDLLTYMSEHALALLTGVEDLDFLPEFKQTLYDLGIQNIIDVYQSAYDRMMG